MSSQRDVQDVLYFRNDLSPFLIHLTKNYNGSNAYTNLEQILKTKKIIYGDKAISAATYGLKQSKAEENDNQKKYFSAVSFTETPLNEIHTLLEISNRSVDLTSFGLVFLKDNLKKKKFHLYYISIITMMIKMKRFVHYVV